MSIVDTQDNGVEDEYASLDGLEVDEGNVDNIEQLDEEGVDDVPERELPAKFKGKSIEDVVNSYTELEKEYGRRNNEIGELRKLTDDFLNLQLSEKKKVDEPEYVLDVDSLLDNPNEAITRAVDNHPKFKQFEEAQRTETIGKAKASFEQKHPDYKDLVKDQDFASWVQESPVRTKMFKAADTNYDYEIGDELFTTYKAIRGIANSEAKEEKLERASQALNKGSVERGSSGTSSTKKVYRRADLINLKISNPAKYAAMEPEIMKAYSEKRVR